MVKFRERNFQPTQSRQKVRRDFSSQLVRQRFRITLKLRRFALGEALRVTLKLRRFALREALRVTFPDSSLEQKGFGEEAGGWWVGSSTFPAPGPGSPQRVA